MLNTECSCNSWGPGCNQTCHCSSGTCHHITGYCDSGCASGWAGVACQENNQQHYYGITPSHSASFLAGII